MRSILRLFAGGFTVGLAAFPIAQNTVLSVGFSFNTHLPLYLACPLVPRCLGKTEGRGWEEGWTKISAGTCLTEMHFH